MAIKKPHLQDGAFGFGFGLGLGLGLAGIVQLQIWMIVTRRKASII